ncbi:hypothetical protein C7G41_28605 [Bradyrhizobium sp. MOS002]|nr:hypothetical protein C7G41_28605 [Bradyrhizobium sp. MOS002]
MLFSGRSIISPYIVHLLEDKARDTRHFDHLMQIMPDELAGMICSLTDLFGIDVGSIARRHGVEQGFVVLPPAGLIGGRRPSHSRSAALTTPPAPFALAKNLDDYQSPGVTSAENFQRLRRPF